MKIYTERLNQIYTQSGIRSIRQFAEAAGLVCGTLTDTLHNGTEPRYTLLRSILNSNPNVSAEWLMRGEGSMYKNDRVRVNDNDNIPEVNNTTTDSEDDIQVIAALQEEIRSQHETIKQLMKLIE